MASTIDLSLLTQYTDQLSTPLLHEAVLGGKTTQLISVQTGVKYADALNLMTSTLVAQAGGCGAISASGSVQLSQRSLQVCNIKVEETVCQDDLEKYWTGMTMKKGSWNELGPDVFNQAYNADKVNKIHRLIEDYAWKGSSTGTYSASLTLCNGFLYTLENNGFVVSYSGTWSGAVTATNAISIVDTLMDQLATNAVDIMDRDDLILFMSVPAYRTYVRAWRDRGNGNGNYWIEADESKQLEFTIPGTNVKAVATVGLNGRNEMVLTSAQNLYFGTDLESDYDQYQIWFERYLNSIVFRAKFKIGFQVAYPQYCVIYKG